MADTREAQITFAKRACATIAVHTYAGPVSRSSGSLFSSRRSHYVAGMLCAVGSQLEWFRRVLSQYGPRDVALSTRPTWKNALRAHCPAQAPSILAGRRAELADIVNRYDWIHRRAYRADVRPTRDIFTPAF